MIQDIIVLTIVFAAAFYTIWATVKSLRTKSNSGCGPDCSCSTKSDIKKVILKKQLEIKNDQLNPIK